MVENYILKAYNISKRYHTKDKEILAVDKFDLEVEKGDFIAIVGPSGCGKSTILSIISNLDKNYSGNIIIDNDIKIGYMLQQDCLFEWRTILKNCLLGLEINNDINDKNIEYVKKLLKIYGLNDFINSYPSSLSGGMRQRVG